jgi:predicted Zn-dependent peptidase
VLVGESHEVPLAWVRIGFRAGSLTDPPGKEGLAAVTLDMMNEGAGTYDAPGLSTALNRLGSDLGTSAGDDGASVWISSTTANLDATLDLLGAVLLHPTFPAADWELMRRQRTADLDRRRKDPDWVAGHLFDHLLFGDSYRGRVATKASYAAITPADMRTWWADHFAPDDAVLLAGGDVSLAPLLPKLEARFAAGGWAPHAPGTGAPVGTPVKVAAPSPQPAGLAPIHLVDRPGAAQSVLRVGGAMSRPQDPDWFPLVLANQVVGGQFTSRINMNLREQKGYTYGARATVTYDLAGGRFVASTGVHSDKTAPALTELLAELEAPKGARPLTAAELDDARASIVNGFPLRFESPDYLLGQEEAIWRYGLPSDWVAGYLGRLGNTTLEQASTAWTTHFAAPPIIVVVGDAAVIHDGLAALGHPIILHDPDGNVLAAVPTNSGVSHGN